MAVGQDFTISPYRDWFINKHRVFKIQTSESSNEHPIVVLIRVKLVLLKILNFPPFVMVRTSGHMTLEEGPWALECSLLLHFFVIINKLQEKCKKFYHEC